MHAGIKEILSFLKERKIRLHCKHIAGEENKMADSLSRLCPGGQYHLKAGALDRVEKALGIVTEIDLFANRRNTQKKTYWTLEKDNKAEGRNASNRSTWKGKLCLVHPPIPLIVSALQRIATDKATAIVIASYVIGKCQEAATHLWLRQNIFSVFFFF
jgi:hypothetical protein